MLRGNHISCRCDRISGRVTCERRASNCRKPTPQHWRQHDTSVLFWFQSVDFQCMQYIGLNSSRKYHNTLLGARRGKIHPHHSQTGHCPCLLERTNKAFFIVSRTSELYTYCPGMSVLSMPKLPPTAAKQQQLNASTLGCQTDSQLKSISVLKPGIIGCQLPNCPRPFMQLLQLADCLMHLTLLLYCCLLPAAASDPLLRAVCLQSSTASQKALGPQSDCSWRQLVILVFGETTGARRAPVVSGSSFCSACIQSSIGVQKVLCPQSDSSWCQPCTSDWGLQAPVSSLGRV